MLGVWLSILLAIGFIGVYAWQITEEVAAARRRAGRDRAGAGARAASLAARRPRRRRRARARHAAVDHHGDRQGAGERASPPTSPHGDDVRLLREQAQRCRDILAKLTELSAGGEPFDRMPLSALIEEVVAPHRNFGVAIDVALPRDAQRRAGRRAQSGDPLRPRQPGGERGRFRARARRGRGATGARTTVAVTISDDGPGFAPEIIDRIGEPYVHQPAAAA